MQSFPFTSQVTYDQDGNIQYDRAVDSIIFRNVLKQYVTNGVFPNPSTNFQVVANNDTDMTVKVNVGACVINGATAYEDEDRILTVQAADTMDRIDTVVLRLNDQVDYRNIDLYIHPGTPAATPTAPALTRTQDIYEIGIANLYVTANSSRITQERITDTRLDTARCGYAMFLSNIDTSALYAQIQADLSTFRSVNEAGFSSWRSGQESNFETWKSTQESDFETWKDEQENAVESWQTSHEQSFEDWETLTKQDVEKWIDDIKNIISDSDVARLTALIQDIGDELDDHKEEVVASQSGVHGFRYYDEQLQYKDPTTGNFLEIPTGDGLDDHKEEVVASQSGVHGFRYYDEQLQYKDPTTGNFLEIPTGDKLEIVSWADGTDEQIAILCALSEMGLIDLYKDCGWRVGDKRQIALSSMAATGVGESHVAQNITLVLSHRGGIKLVDPVKNLDGSDRDEPAFQVDMMNSLATAGYMNPTSKNAGSWDKCARRTWCNKVFRFAFPTMLQPIFEQMKVVTAEEYNATTLKTSNDWFALRAAKEIFGGGTATSAGAATSYSNLTEFNALEQIDWYKTASHRVKTNGGNNSEQSSGGNNWWERSPGYNSAIDFCFVNVSGVASNFYANYTYGLSPFGCIG